MCGGRIELLYSMGQNLCFLQSGPLNRVHQCGTEYPGDNNVDKSVLFYERFILFCTHSEGVYGICVGGGQNFFIPWDGICVLQSGPLNSVHQRGTEYPGDINVDKSILLYERFILFCTHSEGVFGICGGADRICVLQSGPLNGTLVRDRISWGY